MVLTGAKRSPWDGGVLGQIWPVRACRPLDLLESCGLPQNVFTGG